LPYVGTIIGTTAMWQKKPSHIRWMFVFVLPFNLISAATKSSPVVATVITIIGQILSTMVRVFLVPFPIVANTILYIELKKTPVQNQSNIASPNTSI
jgi:hypothetical protein